MSHNITENAASADFGTGLPCPDTGDSGSVWWTLLEQARQQLADRSQWLKSWLPDSPLLDIALSPTVNSSSRFGATGDLPSLWTQTSVADAGNLVFPIGPLPIGRKIVSATARIRNPSAASIPATKPTLTLQRIDLTSSGGTATALGSQADTTAVLATYQGYHDVTISSVNHVILSGSIYGIQFNGETGAGSGTGLILARIYLTLGY